MIKAIATAIVVLLGALLVYAGLQINTPDRFNFSPPHPPVR